MQTENRVSGQSRRSVIAAAGAASLLASAGGLASLPALAAGKRTGVQIGMVIQLGYRAHDTVPCGITDYIKVVEDTGDSRG